MINVKYNTDVMNQSLLQKLRTTQKFIKSTNLLIGYVTTLHFRNLDKLKSPNTFFITILQYYNINMI